MEHDVRGNVMGWTQAEHLRPASNALRKDVASRLQAHLEQSKPSLLVSRGSAFCE